MGPAHHHDLDDVIAPDEMAGLRRARPAPFDTARTPLLRVRVRAIVLADDDGSNSADATPEGVARGIADANAYYASAGIVFAFDPQRDWEQRYSTLMNSDEAFPPGSLDSPNKPFGQRAPVARARAALAAATPDRMTLFFRNFNGVVEWDPAADKWKKRRATGGYSSAGGPYAIVGPGPSGGTYLAHEIGHYLHLVHTFIPQPATFAEAAEEVRRWVEEGPGKGRVARGLDVFAGALRGNGITDIAPDPSQVFWRLAPGGECGPTDSMPLTVRFSDGSHHAYILEPPRDNIMSYFKGCANLSHGFSPQQISLMRRALIYGNRRPLLIGAPPLSARSGALASGAAGPLASGAAGPLALPGDRTLAPQRDVATEWNRIKSTPSLLSGGPGAAAPGAALELTLDGQIKLTNPALVAHEAALKRAFPRWEDFPADAQAALLLVSWLPGGISGFPLLVSAAQRGDWATAANASAVKSQPARTTALRQLFLNAASVAASGGDPTLLWYPMVA